MFSAIGELRRLNIRTFSGLDSKNCKEAWHPDVINLKREQKGRKYDRLHCEIVRGKSQNHSESTFTRGIQDSELSAAMPFFILKLH